MAKRKHLISKEEEQALIFAFTNCEDGEMRTKIQAVRLYGTERPLTEIVEITTLPPRTIYRWYQRYREQGVGGFVDRRQGGNHKYLSDEQITDLGSKLRQYRPVDLFGSGQTARADGLHWTVPDLKRAVQQWYQISYQRPASYQQLFQRFGYSYQRTAKVYRSRSAAKVADFEETAEKKL